MRRLLAMAFAGFVAIAASGCASDMSNGEMMKKDEKMKKDRMKY